MSEQQVKPDTALLKVALQLAYGQAPDQEDVANLDKLGQDVREIYQVLPHTEGAGSISHNWARHLLMEALAWKLDQLEALQMEAVGSPISIDDAENEAIESLLKRTA